MHETAWRVVTEAAAIWKAALPAMFFGCWCGVALRQGRVFAFFSRLCRPFTRAGRMPEEWAPFFILCLLNRYAANAMLAEWQREGRLGRRETVAVYLLGSLPTGVYFTLFYFTPVLLASLGTELGGRFIALHVLLSLLVTFCGLALHWFSGGGAAASKWKKEESVPARQGTWLGNVAEAWRQFWGIAKIFMPVTFLFTAALHSSWMEAAWPQLDAFLRTFSLSAAGILVILAGIPTLIAAIGMAGTFMVGGVLSGQEVLFILLLASFGHNVYDGLSRVLPSNLSIFGASLGLLVTTVGTGLYLAMVALLAWGLA